MYATTAKETVTDLQHALLKVREMTKRPFVPTPKNEHRKQMNPGICCGVSDALTVLIPESGLQRSRANRLMMDIMGTWPGRSASALFPVPHPSKHPADAYSDSPNLWSAAAEGWEEEAYIHARWRLFEYIFDSVDRISHQMSLPEGALEPARAELKKVMQGIKDDLQAGKTLWLGLCASVAAVKGARHTIVTGDLLKACMLSWPKHSGHPMYPVPAPEGKYRNMSMLQAARAAYGEIQPTYVGEYGKLRLELVEHVLSVADTAPNLFGAPLPQVLLA